jgi:hypothetical protein
MYIVLEEQDLIGPVRIPTNCVGLENLNISSEDILKAYKIIYRDRTGYMKILKDVDWRKSPKPKPKLNSRYDLIKRSTNGTRSKKSAGRFFLAP